MLLEYVINATKRKFPSVINMTTQQLAARLESSPNSVLLIDCREEKEYNVSHLSNAHWLQFQTGKEDIQLSLSKLGVDPQKREKDLVCYCAVGYRASILASRMSKVYPQGKIYNLEGSIFKWASEGRPLFDCKGEETHEVHPMHPLWGWLLMSQPKRPASPKQN